MKTPSGRTPGTRPPAEPNAEMVKLISEWLRKVGVENDEERAGISVDLADVLSAADHVSRRLNDLVPLDPRKPDQADKALTVAAEISVYLFEELKEHLKSLEGNWERLLKRLDTLSG